MTGKRVLDFGIVPLNPVILAIVNIFMPIIQRAKSPYEKELTIETIDFDDFKAQLIRPRNKEDIPCMVFLHGGAFILKASRTHKNLARKYAYDGNMAVLLVDYRLAPKYKFPIPFQDSLKAYKWAIDHFQKQKIYICGDSVGGNLALAVTRKTIEEEIKKPDKMMLIYPVTDTRMITDSMRKYVDTPVWNARLNEKIWDLYTLPQDRHNILVSPAEADSYEGFPECYIETAEFDCLRDEGIMLAKQLKVDNVQVTLVNTKGTIHGYEIEKKARCVQACVDKRLQFLKE